MTRARRAPRSIIASLGLLTCFSCADSTPTSSDAPGAEIWFEEVATARGLVFEHDSGHREQFYLPEIMAGGAVLFDMDGDDDLDAYLVQSGRIGAPKNAQPSNALFRNRGDGFFDDVTNGSGTADRGYGIGASASDYDNDGDTDLYVTNLGENTLLRNDGAGKFSDVTAEAGVGDAGWGTSAAFFDYDRDGDLDLYVVNYLNWTPATEQQCFNPQGQPDYCSPRTLDSPAMDRLYRNDGDGTFSDVTEQMGLDAAFGNGLGLVCADFDGDGWLDVFVANDGTLDQLWINLEGKRFEDRALIAGCAADHEGLAKAGMGVTAADVDDDGDLDLMVCNLVEESDSYFRNEGRYFADFTAQGGLGVVSRRFTRFGMAWVDFTNSGFLDLYQANGAVMARPSPLGDDPFAEPNLVFEGGPGGIFVEREPRGATATEFVATSRAAVFGDVNNDGGVDVLIVNRDAPVHLFLNVVPRRGNWILFRVLDEHGRDAEGAILTLRLGDRKLRRDVRTAYSYLAGNDPRVHFGLADTERVDEVALRWLDGSVETFGPFEANALVTLRRGAGR